MGLKKTISLCMIVKDEERFLRQCIESVHSIVDEIIIVDTGSKDQTKAIAKEYTDKVYSFAWDGSFANARNYSIRMATCDWILMLDADEALEGEDKEALLKLAQESKLDGHDFCIRNYSAENDADDYNIHYALRMVRNDRRYAFRGVVHEQYVPIDEEAAYPVTDGTPIHIKHYGYCSEVVKEKNKRSRNIPLIERQLAMMPDDPYYMFTLANEYLADEKYDKATELYEKSLKQAEQHLRYVPYLYQRLIYSYYRSVRYQKAIETSNKASIIYPQCTDYVFLKGLVYYSWHKNVLAADCFKTCIQMGPSPKFFDFISDCSTTKPRLFLANIYRDATDYGTALRYYTEVIGINNRLFVYMYDITECLVRLLESPEEVIKALRVHFAPLFQENNVLLLIDILITVKCYEAAEQMITEHYKDKGSSFEYRYLQGRLCFYRRQYKKAAEIFEEFSEMVVQESALPHSRRYCCQFLFLLSLLDKSVSREAVDLAIERSDDEYLKEVCSDIRDIIENGNAGIEGYESKVSSHEQKLNLIMELLESLLAVKEFDLFEKVLPELNRVDDTTVLLRLGKLYQKYGYYKMAGNTILRSIKELDVFDYPCLDILAENSTLRV